MPYSIRKLSAVVYMLYHVFLPEPTNEVDSYIEMYHL